ncbi:hypothetical protein F5882DRAFT_442174 [Hyaloscypha sp. PMI_1271]|nr:hypothetical protein F5882DRAFT_442174 [Hyaloscypha sp. PMI_1271]
MEIINTSESDRKKQPTAIGSSSARPSSKRQSTSSQTDAASKTQDKIAVEWLDKFLPTAIEIAIFGGSITFTVVISKNNDPAHIFGAGTVTTFLALAWLFFVLALALASIAQMALSVNRVLVLKGFRKERCKASKAEEDRKTQETNEEQEKIFILTAFVFLSLVVVAYRKEVGFIAVGFTGLCTFGAIVAWFVKFYNARKGHGKGEEKEVQESEAGCCL